jgi:hypothetical protein
MFAVCEPEPFAVATWKVKSLTISVLVPLPCGDAVAMLISIAPELAPCALNCLVN